MNKSSAILAFCVSSLLVLAACGPKTEEKPQHKKLLVVNVLDSKDFENCHIADSDCSISMPFDQIEDALTKWNKETELVFYCSNYTCSASGKAAQMAIEKGFKASAYEGGIAEWKKLGKSVEGACSTEGDFSYLGQEVAKPETEEAHDYPVITAEQLAEKIEKVKSASSCHSCAGCA